jgi:hypothetical protein
LVPEGKVGNDFREGGEGLGSLWLSGGISETEQKRKTVNGGLCRKALENSLGIRSQFKISNPFLRLGISLLMTY